MQQLELNYIVLNSNPHRTAKRNGGGGGGGGLGIMKGASIPLHMYLFLGLWVPL